MSWVAVVPMKEAGTRKTRLACRLTPAERHRLSVRMLDHVIGVLKQCAEIEKVAVVSNEPMEGYGTQWVPDPGGGLNAALNAARDALGDQSVLILHGDLPLVTDADLRAMISEAAEGIAIAPDRSGSGTNAIALRHPAGFEFAFGPGSLRRHLMASGPAARLVNRPGLALDVDTSPDLEAALSAGFSFQ